MQRQPISGEQPSTSSSYQKANQFLKAVGQRSAQFLSVGSTGTNFIATIAPNFVSSRVCEIAAPISSNPILNRLNATAVVDMGNYLFLTTGTIRAIVFPSLRFAEKWVYAMIADELNPKKNLISKETQDFLEQLEKSLILSSNTFSFVQNKLILDSQKLTNAISTVSIIPLAEFAGKAIQKKYPKNENFNFILDAVGKLGVVTSTATSARSLASFICDFFVDSTEATDWKGQGLMLDCVLMGAAVVALGLVLKGGSRAESSLKQAAFCTGMFTTITLTLFSFSLCANPSNENVDSFWKNNWLAFLITCFAGIVASALMRYSVKETFKPAAELNHFAEDVTNGSQEKNPNISKKQDIETGFLSQSSYGTFSKTPSSNNQKNIMNLNSDPSQKSDSDSDLKSTSTVNTKNY